MVLATPDPSKGNQGKQPILEVALGEGFVNSGPDLTGTMGLAGLVDADRSAALGSMKREADAAVTGIAWH